MKLAEFGVSVFFFGGSATVTIGNTILAGNTEEAYTANIRNLIFEANFDQEGATSTDLGYNVFGQNGEDGTAYNFHFLDSDIVPPGPISTILGPSG